jgi:type II secretory ATPase GspE/PulE/Tfp pilus assembly ATPase PilB-like protein
MRNIRDFEALFLRDLTQKNHITPEDRANLVKEQMIKKTPILDNVLENKIVDSAIVVDFLATHLKARKLEDDEHISHSGDPVGDELYKEHGVIVQYVDERKAKVYFARPIFIQEWEYIYEKIDRKNIEKVVIPYEKFKELEKNISDGIAIRKQFSISNSKELLSLGENERAIKFANEVLEKCIQLDASDIHIEPQKNNFRIRMRLNGVLQVFGEYSNDFFPSFSSRVKLISNLNIAEKRDTQDGALVYPYVNENNEAFDIPFRVSVMPTIYGEKIVLRKLGSQDVSVTLSHLGMDENILIPWRRMITKPHGIILVSGPTGSGKSTTLQATINEIKSDEINITTVEDPVESKIAGINQVQIDAYKVSFADALRSILRQDPDVIMIGEIRDKETAEIALRASLTGHMVYSTIHTNDAPSSVTRLIDMGIEPFLVSSSVIGVLAQRLVRVLCENCKQESMTNDVQMRLLMIDEPQKIYEPCGCQKCANTGYSSRVGVYELMTVDAQIQKLINSRASDVAIREYALEVLNMPTLYQEGKKKVLAGITSMGEFQKIIAQ